MDADPPTRRFLRGNTLDHLDAQARSQQQEGELQHNACLDIRSKNILVRKTSIVCTVGPATQDRILELRRAGMNIMRMNFSHGTHDYHAQSIANLRHSFEQVDGFPVAIALDTKGPEIRTGLFTGGSALIERGSTVVVSTDCQDRECGTKEKFFCDYSDLCTTIGVGGVIYVDDGLLALTVQSIATSSCTCVAQNTCRLSDRKGINLPNAKVTLPALSDKDKADLAFGAKHGVDMIFASFARKAQDIKDIREYLSAHGGECIQIIAKIENEEGMDNINEICDAADGLMVARGDLGIEIPQEKVFLAQKMMMARCNLKGKPVICATQMLETMRNNPRPTRAELTDVANAVLDGADCVMLSGETAAGKFPEESVNMMSRICLEAEAAVFVRPHFETMMRLATTHEVNMVEAVACSAVSAAFDQQCAAVCVLTQTGRTAQLVAKFRPPCPIICVTQNPKTAQMLTLYRACFPVLEEGSQQQTCAEASDKTKRIFEEADVQRGIRHALQWLKAHFHAKMKSRLVVVYGVASPVGEDPVAAMRIVPTGP